MLTWKVGGGGARGVMLAHGLKTFVIIINLGYIRMQDELH